MLTVKRSVVVKLLMMLIFSPILIYIGMFFKNMTLTTVACLFVGITLIELWAQLVKFRYNKHKKLNWLEKKMVGLLVEVEKYNNSLVQK